MLRNGLIADRLQLTIDDVNALLQGSVTGAVAAHLDVRQMDLQLFVDGQCTPRMAQFFGIESLDAACEFATSVGKDGAIGLVFGLLLSNR